ncbi:centrosomal protein of 290 kDa isoform X2 [Cephus cinctus]|uniref:Centrosomal protein of 290 kDa isoform X2 n=1 Tax=Cephus cinctus TaxID=211228 RepID=A0AAJ7FTQ3_CEPCN|nr:centrosomal protein of 290 kDa isoform X2 [Cephus cinctus]
MLHIDWDRVLSVKAVSLTDEEIEDLFPTVISCEVEKIDNMHNLKALMKLSQEMLQHKDNQVESLLLECDELKTKIHSAVSTSSTSVRKGHLASDLITEDNASTKEEYAARSDYEVTLEEKNRKIETLLLDLEGLEKENITLKEKLKTLKEEMEDATENMNEMTEELSNLQKRNIILKDKVNELELENRALISQVEELTTQQSNRDKIIDEFGIAIDARVTEWKSILDEKDAEISQLKEDLSQSMIQSVTSVREQSKSQIIYLNEELDQRDKTIMELQAKLAEAVTEINESAEVIEKMKVDMRKMEKSGRRKEQRDLLKKVQDANEKISNLQSILKQTEEDAELKSKQYCETLAILKKYEDVNQGLAETISEVKELKDQLQHKNAHIEDLINIVNKMEILNSRRELEILSLREKLGMSEDEPISIDSITLRRDEEAKEREELKQKNKSLSEKNLEMKADIRTLKYKLSKLTERLNIPNDTIDTSTDFVRPTKMLEPEFDWIAEQEKASLRHMTEIDEIKANVRIVIEENEALRKGMHEILDSIHNHDGKGIVEVQSDTLERLLEALDMRHVAGWYHPAMRLQGRLNVVEGSNAELRSQLKQIRKELQKKEHKLQKLLTNRSENIKPSDSELSELEENTNILEINQLRDAYQNELKHWQKERNALCEENKELKDTLAKIEIRLEEYERSWQILESSEDNVRKEFMEKSKECAEAAVEIIELNRKYTVLEDILSKESAKVYCTQKEAAARETDLRRILAEIGKEKKLLENKVATLESNLSNSVSVLQYNEIKDKYDEACLRLRMALEVHASKNYNSEGHVLKNQLELLKQERDHLTQRVHENVSNEKEADVKKLAECESKELIESQHVNHLTKLNEILQDQLGKSETKLSEVLAVNSELQEQLVQLHRRLSEQIRIQNCLQPQDPDIQELKQRIQVLEIENANLKKTAEIAREEAQMHYTFNTLKTFELDSLRHQILDLQAISEDKEIIAMLGIELNNAKALEAERDKRQTILESENSSLREELESSKKKCEKLRIRMQDCDKQCDNRCRSYIEIISYLQNQYAGSTSLSALERFNSKLKELMDDRAELDAKLKEAIKSSESLKLQQEILTNRLEVVERLKDILEQKIGSSDVQDLMHRFSENSQQTLNNFKYKRQIAQLEHELQIVNDKSAAHEATITAMEFEMMNVQRSWRQQHESRVTTTNNIDHNDMERKTTTVEVKSTLIQTHVECQSIAIQCEPLSDYSKDTSATMNNEQVFHKSDDKTESPRESLTLLNEQLSQALTLASERSVLLIKYESQIAEYQAKISALNKAIDDKDLQITERDNIVQQMKCETYSIGMDGTDKMALKSTINSLQKIVVQKEETITRYKNLLKEDRDEHSMAASRLQEEIRSLREQIRIINQESEKRSKYIIDSLEADEKLKRLDGTTRDSNKNVDLEEEIVKLRENVSMLEVDLNIAKELSERWHRLAEERLKHMDRMRERLDEQHKNELESYRIERNKWQAEADTLRQQLSENRMLLAKGNISLAKELQERDNKIHELTMAYQQLQNEFELAESATLSQRVAVHNSQMQEMSNNLTRDQTNHLQIQLDLARRQLQSVIDKEKTYKTQIVELKQQLSRRYMAVKSQEQKASQREIQLERKVRSLEEELHKAKMQLDREHLAQETKKAKTAEELALWDKQKRWQQTAEKFKDKLKEKTEEYKKLQTNYEKLRSVISCMEREKWYLKSKLRFENGSIIGGLSARPVTALQYNIIEDLQRECDTLRDRVKELTDRLDNEDNTQLLCKIQEQRRHIAALEAVTQGNAYVIDQLEKLETAKDILEKSNLKLESENLELRLQIEKANLDTPSLREKVEHLEKYVELLKVEKSSDSTPRSSDKDSQEQGSKKSFGELEKTIFILKRVVEKLQVENKRLRISSKANRLGKAGRSTSMGTSSSLQEQYERAQQQVVALETDLQLAEQRIVMLENARKEEESNSEVSLLKQQLLHKSELLDKVKQLLTKAAINEKALRQQIQQLELRQTLSTIPESYSVSSMPNT